MSVKVIKKQLTISKIDKLKNKVARLELRSKLIHTRLLKAKKTFRRLETIEEQKNEIVKAKKQKASSRVNKVA